MATKWTPELNTLVADRGKTKKGSNEYNVIQNKINKAMGNKTVHSTSATTDTEESTTTDTETTKTDPNIGKKGLYKSDKSWKEGQESAKSSGKDLNALVKSRKSLEKGSNEYNVIQNQINKALGNKKQYATKPTTPTTKAKEFGTYENRQAAGIISQKTPYPTSMIGTRENNNLQNTINNANAPTSLIGGVKTRRETRVANREARTVLKADKYTDKLEKREKRSTDRQNKYADKERRTKTITTDSAGTTTKTISKGDKIKKTVERDSSGNKTTRKYKS